MRDERIVITPSVFERGSSAPSADTADLPSLSGRKTSQKVLKKFMPSKNAFRSITKRSRPKLRGPYEAEQDERHDSQKRMSAQNLGFATYAGSA
jgi:hypothetical protein